MKTAKLFVVYHIKSTMENAQYVREHHARNHAAKLNRKAGQELFAVASYEDYTNNVVKMITVRNLMTGEPVQIPSNTPASCDPSRETYWSM